MSISKHNEINDCSYFAFISISSNIGIFVKISEPAQKFARRNVNIFENIQKCRIKALENLHTHLLSVGAICPNTISFELIIVREKRKTWNFNF